MRFLEKQNNEIIDKECKVISTNFNSPTDSKSSQESVSLNAFSDTTKCDQVNFKLECEIAALRNRVSFDTATIEGRFFKLFSIFLQLSVYESTSVTSNAVMSSSAHPTTSSYLDWIPLKFTSTDGCSSKIDDKSFLESEVDMLRNLVS